MDRQKLLPLHSGDQGRSHVRVSFRRFACWTVCLPLVAFVACVLVSVYKDFERATSTHCKVFNALPSVSAAIGSFYPQNYLWQLAIALHALPRYFTIWMYFDHYLRSLSSRAHVLVAVACLTNVAEVTALVGLSFWDSTDYYPVHKTCFVTFVMTSELYMLLTCLLVQNYKRTAPTEIERDSLRKKWRLLFVNVACILAACYFFVRHNNYCEPMVYTWFAAAEYVVILTNMGFHMTACYDFADKDIVLTYIGIRVK